MHNTVMDQTLVGVNKAYALSLCANCDLDL